MKSPFRHLLWLLLPLHACHEPTHVTVHVTTDVPCERLQGVALTTGKLGSLEDKVATTRTAQCSDGEIGTLTVVPSGDDDGEFAVRVVMGIERDVESCTAPNYGDGCVVARRGLRFLPGESLELPVVMRQICNGIPCGPYDTCVRGTCVPATCKESKSCTEDALTQNGESDGGGIVDSGDGATQGPESEPVTLVQPYCGANTALDANAAWAIRRGCVTRAGVSRFYGPIEANLTFQGVDKTSWRAIVTEEGQRGWGVTNDFPSTVAFGQSPVTQPIPFATPPQSPAFSPAILPNTILFPHQSGLTLVPRAPSSPDFPKGEYQSAGGFTGGPETFLDAWVPYGNGAGMPTMLIVRDGTNVSPVTYELRRITFGTPPSIDAAADVAGTKFADPVLTPDGNTLYVASEAEVHAFDPKTVTSKWAVPAKTGLVGLADRKQRFHTFVFLSADGATTGTWVLRTYMPDGSVVAPDVVLVDGAIVGSESNLTMALALIPGSTDDVAIVGDGASVSGVDLVKRSVLWKQTGVLSGGRAQIVSTPNVTYLASPSKLTAIAAADGKVIFNVKADWMLPLDIAVGPARSLYVADNVLFYRAGPKFE